MARKPVPPETDFRTFGEQVIRERLRKMLSYTDAVRSGDDIEAVHDMRVASRRARAALSVFAAAIIDPEFADFQREVRTVTKALGAARDLDVMIQTLETMEMQLPASAHGSFDRLLDEKRRQRAGLQAGVVRAIARLGRRDLGAWFDRIAARGRGETPPHGQGGVDAAREPAAAPPQVSDEPAPEPVATPGGER